MKGFQVFLILGLVAATICGPVTQKTNKDDSSEVFDGMDDSLDINTGVIDTGFPTSYFGNPLPLSFNFGNPFSGFWKQMEESMRQLQQQMTKVLNRLPAEGDFSNWQPIADGKGNTTSTVKVIDGHKVVINETVYSDTNDDKNFGSFFKIRVVQVKPTSEEETNSGEQGTKQPLLNREVEETTPNTRRETEVKGSPETLNEVDNEILRSNHPEKMNTRYRDVESLEDLSSPYYFPEDLYSQPSYNYDVRNHDLNSIRPVADIDTNDVNVYNDEINDMNTYNPHYRDLSNDIYINQMIADEGHPINPDVEVFQVEPKIKKSTFKDLYDRDLSHDLYINKMMADQGYPHDSRAAIVQEKPTYQGEIYQQPAYQYNNVYNSKYNYV